MTRELIEDMREVILPFLKGVLLKTNYEGLGKSDAKIFERDFNEILNLAIKALEQEPCEDAISRQEVLELIADYDLSMGQVVRGIHALPSVTPQEPRWIPVSERLPNKNQWVLATTEDYQKIAEVMCYQGIRIGQHDIGNGWEEYEYPSWTSGHGDIQGKHPKAWMPLPTLYEPRESEDKE